MTTKEGRGLKVGDRVYWSPDGALGTVRETSYAAVKIQWDDDQWALFPFHDDAPWAALRASKAGA